MKEKVTMAKVKKILIIIGMILIGVPCVSVHASNLGGGSCGNNASWVLDENGVLTISGSGDVTSSPWSNYAGDIKSVVIEKGIKSLPENAFYASQYSSNQYEELSSVSMANTVTTIGDEAFKRCSKLKNVKLSSNLTDLGAGTFIGCTSLESISVPDKVKEIGNDSLGAVFSGCTSLTKISLGKINEIGHNTFANCVSLETVTIPATVTEIDWAAFEGCTSLSNVIFKEGGNWLTIKSDAFARCTSLKTLNLPDHIYDIYGTTGFVQGGAFNGCSNLNKIVIGSGLKTIGVSTFYGCESLKEIYFCGDAPEFGNSNSDEVFKTVTATAYYQKKNSTWKASSLAGHGGNLTWVAWDVPISHAIISLEGLNITSKGVKLSWNKAISAKGYYVYRKEGKGSWKKIKTISKNSWTDTSVKNGKKYTYKIYAYNASGNSRASNSEVTYYLTKVNIKKIKRKSYYSLNVSWKKNSAVTGYQLEYSTKKSFYWHDTKVIDTGKKTSYTLYLSKGTKYYFRVRGYKKLSSGKSYSVWSNIKSK